MAATTEQKNTLARGLEKTAASVAETLDKQVAYLNMFVIQSMLLRLSKSNAVFLF